MQILLQRIRGYLIILPIAICFTVIVRSCVQLSNNASISRSDLEFIREGISYDEVISRIGEPKKDIGSGVYLFEYNLDDGSQLRLGFIQLDYLFRAVIIEKDGKETNLLE